MMNKDVYCVLILQGVMSWGFRPALPLTGLCPVGLCPPIAATTTLINDAVTKRK